ncbi:MAG: Gfo/Idh/MocA family oxidoreductase [Proteobacteria bacterium]|nr:Gfo/Idh/MocA family oxidoreductase [Pseudomonadota bacterium]
MTLRIGQVGCGQWGELVLRDLKALGAHVSVVARSDLSKSRAKAQSADKIVSSIGELDSALDGYVVVTTTDQHAPAVEALIPRGKPIFVEKALTHDPVAAHRIVAAAGDRVFVMDKWRYHAGVEELRRLVSAGSFGKIHALHSLRASWSMNHAELDSIWLLLPHDLAIVYHVLGAFPKPVSAHGRVLSQRGAELSAFLTGQNGEGIHIDVSSLRPTYERKIVLVGEKATAELGDSYARSLKFRMGSPGARDAREELLPIADTMPLLEELRCFLAYLQGGPRPMSSAVEGTHIVETIVELRRLAGLN